MNIEKTQSINWLAQKHFSLEHLQFLVYCFFAFYSLEAYSLFLEVLPKDNITGYIRIIASIAIGVVVGAILMTVIIYAEQKKTNYSVVWQIIFAAISFFLTLKFFGVLDTEEYYNEENVLVKPKFEWTLFILSAALVLIEVKLAKLFYEKYAEMLYKSELKAKYKSLIDEKSELEDTKAELEKERDKLKGSNGDLIINTDLLKKKIGELEITNTDLLDTISKLEKIKSEFENELSELKKYACTHCGMPQSSPQSKKRHEANCPSNSNKKA